MCNSKLNLKMWERGHDIGGMLRHSVFISEKAATRSYTTSGLAKYDESVRKRANKWGVSEFTAGDLELTVRHLGADSTRSYRKNQPHYQGGNKQGGRRSNQNRQARGQGTPPQGDRAAEYCMKYNGEGCTYTSCKFPHVCAYCFKSGHTLSSCYSLSGGPAPSQRPA